MFHVEHLCYTSRMSRRASYDVIVVGGGHAGCEAAAAAARMGAATLMVTYRRADIGSLSCNPAIGGLGKGHLVREIDALDGLIGRVADAAAIQFRMLNRSKGPAVQGPRAQIDRDLYRAAMQEAIAATPRLEVTEDEVLALIVDGRRICGVETRTGVITATAVVVTAGTFLHGTMHTGTAQTPGGRLRGASSNGLADSLVALGLSTARLKTGTPPRLDGRTIDWATLEWQRGDDEPSMFSTCTVARAPSLPCAVTRTTAATHDIVRRNVLQSAIFNGAISGKGPRYCPSLEDKVTRFGDRDGHQIFLEPEGVGRLAVYPNGISTSLPAHIQAEVVATIPGLKRAVILQPGYAVEYDHVDPRQLGPGLAVRSNAGLFLAGQVNGTTGYEEAAGQGIVAGINAARHAAGLAEIRFDRATSYIGVMIDDLVTQGVTEPYRMFTSRAEYRLRLRIDNADERLTPFGIGIGVVSRERQASFATASRQREIARHALASLHASPTQMAQAGAAVCQDGVVRTGVEWLELAAVDWSILCGICPSLRLVPKAVADSLVTDARYAPYLVRQDQELARHRRDEGVALPTLDYGAIAGLSTEMIERLVAAQPTTLGAASRIPGVTPAALAIVLAQVRKAA